jgi:hypothetical protein
MLFGTLRVSCVRSQVLRAKDKIPTAADHFFHRNEQVPQITEQVHFAKSCVWHGGERFFPFAGYFCAVTA